MDSKYDDDFIYGNFIGDPRPAFPIDVETLAAIQNNTTLTAVLGRIIGADKAILCGCEVAGTTRQSGYVWIKSPERETTGEILYFKGGSGDTCYIHNADEDSQLLIDNVTYNGLYTRRQLKPGLNAGGQTYSWGDFTRVGDLTLVKLMAAIERERADRAAEVEAMKNNAQYTFVRGMIMLWSGASSDTIPSGWALCDGKSYTIDGENVRTPDLRDKFVIGAKGVNGSGDRVDYNTGETGGATSHQVSITLTASDVPMHRHSYMSDSHSEGVGGAEEPYYVSDRVSGDFSAYGTGGGKKFLTENRIYDKQGKSITTYQLDDTKTVTSTVNTMPPYYALAYIMKL
jgi:microcystin-dependent protein